MRKFSLLSFLLIILSFACMGAETAPGANGSINFSGLQVNLTNPNPGASPPGEQAGLSQSVQNAGNNSLKPAGSDGFIDSSALRVNLTNQNPDAARPGEPVELTVSVQNVGKTDLTDIIIKINPEYPFLKITGESLEKKISYLNARQENDDAAVLKFRLMTDVNASKGTYTLDIITTARESVSSNIITTVNKIQLEVRGKEYAQVVTISKANIDIAKEEPLEFIITNTGNSPLKNMVVSWRDPEGTILPLYSDNTKYIKYLDPGDSITVAYSVMADVNANPGLHALDVNLSFEDYESNEKSIRTTAGLFVGGETDFDVSFSESSAGEVSLSVANVGNNMAYAVKVSIPYQEGYRVSGSSSTIVGNLEKGDYTIASFNITSTEAVGTASSTPTVTDEAEGGVSNSTSSSPLKVQIEYTDAKGERIKVDKEVAVPASGFGTGSKSEVRNNRSYGLYLILLVVVIVTAGAGIFLYRKKKQDSKRGRT